MRRSLIALIACSLAWLPACDKPGPTAPPDEGDGVEDFGPSDPLEAAAKKIAQGKPDEALAIIEAELEKKPDDYELLFSKGVALRELGDIEGAMAAWDASLVIEPDFFGALHAKGAVYLEQEAWADAMRTLSQAAAAKDDHADVHYNLALAVLGAGAAGQLEGDAELIAINSLKVAHELDAEDVQVTLALADLTLKRIGVEEAAPLIEQAVKLAPGNAQAHAAKGRLSLKRGDGKTALASFDRALELQADDAGFELGRAQALLRLDRSEEAQAALEALSKRAPDSAVVWLEWGTALAKQGKFEPALEKIDEALARAPHLISTQVRRIGLLSDLGRCKQAKAALATLRKSTSVRGAIAAAEGAVAGCG